mmetsp:Transcript_21883/g.52916  ORF Transcript_21883/g.52916 Transcript_21883/m.52916 type:complete len:93 (+) Transcript_21883:1303-1581(+)
MLVVESDDEIAAGGDGGAEEDNCGDGVNWNAHVGIILAGQSDAAPSSEMSCCLCDFIALLIMMLCGNEKESWMGSSSVMVMPHRGWLHMCQL